jgi:hypothetical protein
MVEQGPLKPWVGGSSPPRLTFSPLANPRPESGQHKKAEAPGPTIRFYQRFNWYRPGFSLEQISKPRFQRERSTRSASLLLGITNVR